MNYNYRGPLSNEQLQDYAPSVFAGQAYHNRSDKYVFVPTVDIVDGMRNAGFAPVSVMQSGTRIAGKENFTKHMIRFRSQDARNTINGSAIETVLINSHDGTSSYHLMLGVFRMVCSNGLIVGDMFDGIHVRHIGNIVSAIVDANTRILQNAPRIVETINQWQRITLTYHDMLVFAESAYGLHFEQDSKLAEAIKPEALLNINREQDNNNDLWTVFNRVQENLIRGGLRGRSNDYRRVRTRSIKSIDANVKLNKALWTLADKMAEIKA